MPRLPIPGGDESQWGNILNEYLQETHDAGGALKTNTVGTAQLRNGSITAEKISGDSPTAGQLLSYDGTALAWHTPTAPETPETPEEVPLDAQIIVAANAPAHWQALKATKLTGVNDHLALQAAINNGPVLLSPGTFVLGGPITISAENPKVIGSGWSTVLRIANGSNIWAIDFNPPGNGVRGYFAQFQIDGNCTNQTAGGGLHARGAVQSEFHFVHFRNCYDAGLWLDGFPGGAFGHHNKVTSCLFDSDFLSAGLGRGLLINSNDENYVRSEFQFLGGSAGRSYAIRDMSGLNIFDGSVFVGGRNNMGGIELRDGQRSQIISCTFDGVSGHNIFVASSSGHIITNNTFTSVADQAVNNGDFSGIYLEYAVSQCIISHNILDTSQTAGRTRSLIREDGAGDTGKNIITENILRQNQGGTPSNSFFEPNGAGSLRARNFVDGTLVP